MQNERLIFEEDEYQSIKADETLQATALIYLQDAILNERYEEAAELLQSARGFGASKEEISAIIADSIGKRQTTIARF